MKRVFAIMMVLGFALNIQAETTNEVTETVKSVTETVKDGVADATQTVKDGVAAVDTSSLYKTIYNDAKSGIMGLADALKVGAEHVYKVLVKQQIVNSITDLLIILILSLVLYKAFPPLRDWATKHQSASDGFSWFIALALMVVVVVPLGFYVFDLNDTVMGFVNPEYGAMKDIMNWADQALNGKGGCSTCN